MGEAKQIEAEMRGYGAHQEGFENWRPEEESWPSDAELEFNANNERQQLTCAVG